MADEIEQSVSNIVDGLWLGSEGAASSRQFFEKENIKACINATPSVLNNFAATGVEYLRLSLDDDPGKHDMSRMQEYLPLAVEWLRIHHQVLGLNVLVHCHAGVNRSATVVCAYLMKHFGMTFKDAVEFLIIRRQAVFYNGDKPTFKRILEEWGKMC